MPAVSVYMLFRSEAEAAAWEAGLPADRLGPREEGGVLEVLPAASIRDDSGGFYEGSFRKLLSSDPGLLAEIIRARPANCYDPRKDGFAWRDMAAICTGLPEDFATEYVPAQEESIDMGLIGGGGGGGPEM
ncbi:MAG: hypothetical protein OHK0024_37010 [Thalassobaculales bacterium]